jgi:PAS domain S-box-containing protein
MANDTVPTRNLRILTKWTHPFLAQLVPLAAAALQWVLWPVMKPHLLILFYPAMLLSTWIGGLGGGIAATISSALLALYFFAPPTFSFQSRDPWQYIAAGVFVTVGVLFSVVHDRLRKSIRQTELALMSAEAARDELESRVRERTAELRKANEQLIDSEEHMHMLISEVNDYAIFMLDPYGRIASWNEGAKRIKGYDSEEILGKHFSIFYSAEERDSGKPDRELQEAVAKGHYTEEGPRLRKDGSTFWASLVITPLYDKNGKLRGFSKVTRDTTQRKTMEQELRTLAAVARNSKDFIGICSLDLKGAFLNEAGLQMVGLDSLEQARNTMVMDYFWPEDRKMIEEQAVPALLRDGQWRGEVRFRNFKTGEPIHTVWDAFAIRDESGKTTGYATISPNLDRYKQLQAALSEADKLLRESQTRHAGIVASAMDAIITVNNEQKIVVFNPAAEKMFQCPAAQALGESISKFIPERFRKDHSRHVRKFGENGSTSRAMGALNSLSALRGNGEEFPIEASISKMETNGNQLFTVIVRDITERVAVEEALRRSEATRTVALESAQLGEWQLDLQTGVTQRSLSHDRIFGYTEKLPEWNLDIFMKHVHPEDQERIGKAFKECVEQGTRWDFEFRIVRPDKTIRWIWASGNQYKDKTGKSTHVMGTVADITERKRLEESRLRSQKLEGLGTLAGGISHDFNNILLAISGNTRMASSDLPPDHPAQESLKEIVKAASRATDLVRRILAFSRPQELKQETVQIPSLVEEALKLLRATLPANIEVRTDFVENLPAVNVDATQIHQVIVNLAVNASHAIGSKKGLLEFKVRPALVEDPETSASMDLPQGNYVRLSVSDNGCGMDRRTLDQIFDPFFTTKAPGEGTGLGLSVVHGILSSHGGAIRVYSEPGRGTAFHLYFPASEGTVETAGKVANGAHRGGNQHILYVDDDEGLVFLGTRMLRRLGYRVTGHVDASLALAEFRSRPQEFDFVVSDLSMPRMSGLEFAQGVLSIRPDIPIVISTGYIRPEDQEKAQSVGVLKLIQKPHTMEHLQQTLAQVFERAPEAAGEIPR